MRRFNIHFFILYLIIIALLNPLSAEMRKKTGQAGMTFLKIDGNARAAGMGGTFVAVENDVISVFYNPAGLGTLSGTALALSQTNWIADIKHNALSLAIPLGSYGTIGFSAINMDYGTLYGTTVSFAGSQSVGFEYEETGTFSVSDYAVGIAYAVSVTDRFNIGAHARYVHEDMGQNLIDIGGQAKVSDNTVENFAFDMGTLYHTGYKDLTLGMSVRNFSGETTFPNLNEGFYMPLVYTIGLSVDLIKIMSPNLDDHRLTFAVEGLHPNDSMERVNMGLEYSFNEFFFLRGGYKINYDIEDLAGGLGFRFNLGPAAMKFDYAISKMKYFDNVQRMTLSVSL